MDNTEIKKFIAAKVAEGVSLSKIQDELTAQGMKMTFMELRLLASEIENDIFKQQEAAAEPEVKEEPAPEQPAAEQNEEENYNLPPYATAPAQDAPAENTAEKVRGNTSVTVSPIQRPGYYATGTVKFGSGAEAEWFLDQSGRLGLDPTNGMKPDQQDIAEFQQELRKAFGA